MSILFQKNRVYSLVVGTQEDAIEITNLQIKFEVVKTSDNSEKKNQAKVEIYNLTEERRKALEEDYVTVSLRVGYSDLVTGDIPLLFSGQVVDLKSDEQGESISKKQNTDIVTTLSIDELFPQLNMRVVSKTIPAGKSVRDAILGIVKDMPEITRHEIGGEGVGRQMIDGLPMSGTPKQLLDQICKTYTLKWQIDNNILYVTDIDGSYTSDTTSVPKIGQFSGLIQTPRFQSEDVKRLRHKNKVVEVVEEDGTPTTSERKTPSNDKNKKSTLHVTTLLNPTIIAGSAVYLDYEDISGYYNVDEVKHVGDYRGRDWKSDLILSAY